MVAMKIDTTGFEQAADRMDQTARRMDAEIRQANAEIGAMMVATSEGEIDRRTVRRTGKLRGGEEYRVEGRKVRVINPVWYSRFVAAKKGDWHKAAARRRSRVIRQHYIEAAQRALGAGE